MKMMLLLLLLQEKVACMFPTCVKVLAWIAPYLVLQARPNQPQCGSLQYAHTGKGCMVGSAKPKPFGRGESQLQLQRTVCPVAPDYSSIILKYHEAYMTVVRTSVNMITLLQQELSYQIKPHQLMCYRLKQPSKTLTSIYSRNAASHWTGCIVLHS